MRNDELAYRVAKRARQLAREAGGTHYPSHDAVVAYLPAAMAVEFGISREEALLRLPPSARQTPCCNIPQPHYH